MSWVESGNGLIIPGGVGALGLPPGQRQLTVTSNGWTWDDPRKYPVGRPYGSEMRYSSWAEMEDDGWMRSGLTDSNFYFLGDAVQVTFPAQSARIYRAAPAGDFEIVAHLFGPWVGAGVTQAAMLGPVIVDSAGTGVGASTYNNPSSWWGWGVQTWQYLASSSPGDTIVDANLDAKPVWHSLRKIGSTTYHRVSDNQSTWNVSAEKSWTPSAFTPAYVGICRLWTSGGNNPSLIIHRFRVVSGTWAP